MTSFSQCLHKLMIIDNKHVSPFKKLAIRFRVLGMLGYIRSLSGYTFYLVLGRCRCLEPIMKPRQGRGLFMPVIDPGVCRYFRVITITCQYLKYYVIFKICQLKEKLFKKPEIRLWVERTIYVADFPGPAIPG